MQPSSAVVTQVDNISKLLGSLNAVDALSFDVYRGEIFGLLGPNGADLLNLQPYQPERGRVLTQRIDWEYSGEAIIWHAEMAPPPSQIDEGL